MSVRKYRRGDVVSVRAVVKYDTEEGDSTVHVTVSDYSKCTVDLDEITAFIQPAVKVDEVVWLSDDHSQRGTVKAVAESGGATFLMVETDPGRMETWTASLVEVVPPPPPVNND